MIGGNIKEDNIVQFQDALTEMEAPILAYCRSGTRSITLWSLSQTNKMDADDILKATQKAGYDMSGVVKYIKGLQNNKI